MPDVYTDGYQAPIEQRGGSTTINHPDMSVPNPAVYTGAGSGKGLPTGDPYANEFSSALSNAYKNTVTADWATSEAVNEPTLRTPVNFALRYLNNWNKNIGFDVTDPDLEQKYGAEQGFVIRGVNRMLKTGATAAVSFAESIEAVGNALTGQESVDSASISNSNEWLRNLDTEVLPNFQTFNQRDNPIQSYFTPWNFTDWMDNLGGVTQNLGYTIGAIAAAAVVDLPLMALSGALGAAPLIAEGGLLARQAGKIFQAVGKLSRLATSTGEEYNAYRSIINNGESVLKALDKSSDIVKGFNATRFLNGVAVSAYGEAIVEGNNTYLDTKEMLKGNFTDAYGNYNGDDATTAEIEQLAKSAGKAVVAPNFAFLAVSNMIGLGTVLRPASAAIRATEEALAREVSMSVNPLNINTFDIVANQTKGIKGIFNKALGGSSIITENLREAAEEGYQFAVGETYKDFYARKFNPQANVEANTFADSLGRGVHDLFNTTEGQQNMVLGFLGGAMQHVGKSVLNRNRGIKTGSALAADIQSTLARGGTVTGLFDVARNEAVTATDINFEMQRALKKGDIFEYKNLQVQQLFNFVQSGVAANKFDLRIDQLNALKSLDKENFETLFNLELNSQNQKTVHEYIDSVVSKAHQIKSNIDKVNTVYGNNPFSRKNDSENHAIFEDYKRELANAVSSQQDYLTRSKQVRDTIFDTLPAASVESVIALSDTEGIMDTAKRLRQKINSLKESETAAAGNSMLTEAFRKEREFLEEHVNALEKNSGVTLNTPPTATPENFNPDLYLQTVTALYNYYGNGESPTGESALNEMDVMTVYNNSIDLHRLRANTDRIRRYYREMSGTDGFKTFKEDFARRFAAYNDKVRIDSSVFVTESSNSDLSLALAFSLISSVIGVTPLLIFAA